MYIACTLKKEAEKAKTSRAVLNNLNNFKNFIAQFELDDTVIYEKIDENYKDVLDKILELFYKNHFLIMISCVSPLGITTGSIGHFHSPRVSIRFEIPDILQISRDKETFEYYPNFCLEFFNILLSTEFLAPILYEIKKEFSYKKLDTIYHDILDIFAELIKKNRELSTYETSIIMYYNFNFVFSITSSAVKLVFKRLGWSYTKKPEESRFKYIMDEISNRIEKKYSIRKDQILECTSYVLYVLIEKLIKHEIQQRTLKKIFLDEFLMFIRRHISPLGRDEGAFSKHVFIIPKHNNARLLLPRHKLILYALRSILYKMRKKFQEIEDKLQRINEESGIRSSNSLNVSIYHNDNFYIINMYYTYVSRFKNINIMSVRITDEPQEYRVQINIHAAFYHFIKKIEIDKVFLHQHLSTLLELVNIDKYNFKFILRKIEAEFIIFE